MRLHKPLVGALALASLTLTGVVHGDAIIFKDGFFLQGKVRQDQEFISDPSGQGVMVPKGGYFMDDVVRRITFPHSYLMEVIKPNQNDSSAGLESFKMTTRIGRTAPEFGLPILDGAKPDSWNDKWERDFVVGRIHVLQRLGILTPYYARADALRYNWSAYFLINELGAETVRSLLASHPDLKPVAGKPDLRKRLRVYGFLAQAGWYQEANRELDDILKDFPDAKDKIEENRVRLKKLWASQMADDIERAYRVGQHALAQKRLAEFPEQADEKVLSRVRALQAKYEAANENLKQARHCLEDLSSRLAVPAQRELFKQAVSAILGELTLDDFLPDAYANKAQLQRLDSFLGFAQQAERARQAGRVPAQSPAQLLSLAVSGWLLGKDASEDKIEVAHRLWVNRQFLLEYQRTNDASKRGQLVESRQSRAGETTAFDEYVQMLGMLPPAEPEDKIGSSPAELETRLPSGGKRGGIYLVQLPPEYHAARAYPVLFALHGKGEKPREMLERLSAWAGPNGYILVAPEWSPGFGGYYGYTAEEHAAVLDTLNDLRRRFQVDSDRVFLLGFEEGGKMAFDVGLSHPDLFAGVVPIGGRPRNFALKYWPNNQYLPFYVVNGDRDGENLDPKRNYLQQQFDKWITLGYPALSVQYRGRGLEWFEGEIPTIFNWMERKRRARAVPELGRGAGGPLSQEFQSMRATDNRFYWLSSSEIDDRHINDAQRWNVRTMAATFQGRIGTNNAINVYTRGLKQVTVWLGRDMLIDFDKPIAIRLNGNLAYNRRVQPSLATVLEDFYLRGDRQRLFLARVDFNHM